MADHFICETSIIHDATHVFFQNAKSYNFSARHRKSRNRWMVEEYKQYEAVTESFVAPIVPSDRPLHNPVIEPDR